MKFPNSDSERSSPCELTHALIRFWYDTVADRRIRGDTLAGGFGHDVTNTLQELLNGV